MAAGAEASADGCGPVIFAIDNNLSAGRITGEEHGADVARHGNEYAAAYGDIEDFAGGAIAAAGIGHERVTSRIEG